jgi:hypothetical protein
MTPAVVVWMGLTVMSLGGVDHLVAWCSQDSSNSVCTAYTQCSVTTTTDWTIAVGTGSAGYVINYGYGNVSSYGDVHTGAYNMYGMSEIIIWNGSTFVRKYWYPISSSDTAFYGVTAAVGRGLSSNYTVLAMNVTGTIRYITNVHSGMTAGGNGTALAQSIVTACNRIIFNPVNKKFYCCDHSSGKVMSISMNASGVPQAPVDLGYVTGSAVSGMNIVAIDNLGGLIVAQNGSNYFRRLDVVNGGNWELLPITSAAIVMPTSAAYSNQNVIGCGLPPSTTNPSFYCHNYSSSELSGSAFVYETLYKTYPASANTPAAPVTETTDLKYYIKMG